MATASKDNAGWLVNYTIAGAGEKTITFKTEDKFVDADARAVITTPSAAAPTLSLTDITTGLSMGTATDGKYSPTVSASGNVNIATAGWITADNKTVTDTNYKIGTVNQSIMQNGQSTVSSGDTIVPGPSEQTITITEGYNAARTIIIGSASASSPGEVTSGSATITSVSYAYVAADNNYTITGSGDVSAPTVNIAGYVSGSIGTLNSNVGGATVSTTVPAIKLNSTLSGATSTLKPTLSKQSIAASTGAVDAANGAASATAPTSGVYVAVRSNANTGLISSAPAINTAGYGAGTNFIAGTYASATVGAAQSDIYYIPIKEGSVTSGSATIDNATYTYNTSVGNFTVSGSATIAAPTFTEGYIAASIGTKNTNTATLATTVAKIGIQANLSGTGTKTPSITKNSATNITAAGTATTTRPDSGYYVAVSSAANTDTVQATASVTSAGYGTATSGQYTTTPSSNLTVGAAASAVTYVPITAATYANSATSGTTYTDISASVPALISGDYLYINAGYAPASKISLAKLVPDASGDNAPAAYILSGYTAYDNDGTLIVGTMATYDGTYTIT